MVTALGILFLAQECSWCARRNS